MATTCIRVTRQTFEAIQSIIDAANQKDFGRQVKAEDVISLALSQISQQQINALRETTLSNFDRIERAYKEYSKTDATLSKDQFFGLVMVGKVKIQ